MQRFILQIISVTKQKISNYRTEKASDDVGQPVVDTSGTAWDNGFLHDFSEQPVGNADGQCNPEDLSAVFFSVFLERLAIAPRDGEDKSCIHQQMHQLVNPKDRLDMWKTRTRQPCQHQNHQRA